MGILEGRKAILIGASSGVGYGTALRYAEEGADVVVGARRLERLQDLVEDAKARGFSGKIIPVRCDVDQEADLDSILKVCIDSFGRVDILACIAQGGLNDQRPFIDTDMENLLLFYRTGPGYTLQMIQKCLPYMKEQHYGRILTCASGAGVSYVENVCAYGMCKAAVINLTRVCAHELGRYGVTTNCFLPVLLNDHFINHIDSAPPMEVMEQVIPVGFLGEAYKDGSPLLAFLVSEQAHYINGQVISVCGGLS